MLLLANTAICLVFAGRLGTALPSTANLTLLGEGVIYCFAVLRDASLRTMAPVAHRPSFVGVSVGLATAALPFVVAIGAVRGATAASEIMALISLGLPFSFLLAAFIRSVSLAGFPAAILMLFVTAFLWVLALLSLSDARWNGKEWLELAGICAVLVGVFILTGLNRRRSRYATLLSLVLLATIGFVAAVLMILVSGAHQGVANVAGNTVALVLTAGEVALIGLLADFASRPIRRQQFLPQGA